MSAGLGVLLTGEALAPALWLGRAHAVLFTGFPGHSAMATPPPPRAVADGVAARIQR